MYVLNLSCIICMIQVPSKLTICMVDQVEWADEEIVRKSAMVYGFSGKSDIYTQTSMCAHCSLIVQQKVLSVMIHGTYYVGPFIFLNSSLTSLWGHHSIILSHISALIHNDIIMTSLLHSNSAMTPLWHHPTLLWHHPLFCTFII